MRKKMSVTLHTNLGDIKCEIACDEVPKAAEFTMESASLLLQFSVQCPTLRGSGRVHPLGLPNLIKLRKDATKSSNSPTKVHLATANGVFRQDMHRVGGRDGIIIVDHGSRRKESNQMLNEFVTMFRDKTGYLIVEPAHMELAEPSIRDAFNLCVKQGANRIIVNPFFLFPGRHWHQDIPSLTAEAAKDHPGVPYIISAPLGLHELLVDVANDRIKHCLSHVAGDADECSVCAGTDKCRLH